MASELGFEWAATDSGVLNRTLGRAVPVDGLYRPYCWRQGGKTLNAIFRDHFLSDLIGFVYAKMDAAQAAEDFLRRIRENCAGLAAAGRDALVPIILDGENAWEYYDHNGRPFLRELYRRISEDRRMRAVTVSEALRLLAPEPVDHIFPGSWIDANFDVWIGAEEDNQAWTQLLRARRAYDSAAGVPEDAAAAGSGGAADRGRQRLVLVVRAGTPFGQPRGIRPALSQPPRQRLPFSESHAAGGAFAAHPADGAAGGARRAIGAGHAGDRWPGDLVLRMDRRGNLSRGRALRLDARQDIPGEGSAFRQRRRELLSARGFPRGMRAGTGAHGSASDGANAGRRAQQSRSRSASRMARRGPPG